MDLNTFYYSDDKGWSISKLPKLDSSQALVIVFFSSKFVKTQKPIEQILKTYPNSIIIGCSTSGEIFNTTVYDETIVVSVIKFKNTKISCTSAKISPKSGSFSSGQIVAKNLNSPDLRGVFILSDGLEVNGSELIKGINSVLTEGIIVTGGLAGDGDRFKQTWVLSNNKIQSGIIVGIGFYGDKIQIGHGSKGGWDTFGPERLITKSQGNILYELDEKPALSLYKDYLGDRAEGLPATGLLFPLAIRKTPDSPQLVRTILGIDESNQSLRFAGDMPTGYLARLMRANFDRLVTGASDAAILAAQIHKNSNPVLSIAISCIGRRLLLGEYIDEEAEATISCLPKGTQQIGFYSYGEISPYATGYCDLHNQTMTLTTISEKP